MSADLYDVCVSVEQAAAVECSNCAGRNVVVDDFGEPVGDCAKDHVRLRTADALGLLVHADPNKMMRWCVDHDSPYPRVSRYCRAGARSPVGAPCTWRWTARPSVFFVEDEEPTDG